MKLDEMTLDVEQHVEVKAAIGSVYRSVLHRFGEGNTNMKGEPMQLILEQWPGGRWFRDRGNGIGHLWGHVQVIKAPTLLELSGPMFMSYPALESCGAEVGRDPRRHPRQPAAPRHRPAGPGTSNGRDQGVGTYPGSGRCRLFVRSRGAKNVMPDDLDAVWKALSDPTRRAILDLLRQGPLTTSAIVEAFPQLSRFGVMKHIEVLREAALIDTREEGRQRVNSLNVVPIRQIYERWVAASKSSGRATSCASKSPPNAKPRPISRVPRGSAAVSNQPTPASATDRRAASGRPTNRINEETMTATDVNHKVVSSEEWLQARKAFLAEERAFTHQRDELSRKRRELPWVKLEKQYVFDGPQGPVSLAELFGNRSQLIVYHFMFGPGWKQGCPSCSFVADHFGGMLVHLADRDVSLAAVSRATIEEIEPFRKRMGWSFPWVSSTRQRFQPRLPRLLHAGGEGERQRCTTTTAPSNFPAMRRRAPACSIRTPPARSFTPIPPMRGGSTSSLGAYNFLDLAPKGRSEEGMMPHPMAWVRHHDRYADAPQTGRGSCCAEREHA